MAFADTESGSDLDAGVITELAPELEAALQRGPRTRKRRPVLSGNVDAGAFAGEIDTRLRAEAGVLAECETLFDARLRGPEPEVAGAGEGRDADLSERGGFARGDDRLILADRERGVTPVEIECGDAQPHKLVQGISGSSPKIHVQRAADFSSTKNLRALELEAENALAERCAVGCRAGLSGRCQSGDDWILLSSAVAAVGEGIEQKHASELDRQFVIGLDFRLRLFVDPFFDDGDALVKWRRGRSFGRRRRLLRGLRLAGGGRCGLDSGRGKLLTQGFDLRHQLPVLILQALEPLEDLLRLGSTLCEYGKREKQRQRQTKSNSHGSVPRSSAVRRRVSTVYQRMRSRRGSVPCGEWPDRRRR